MIYPPPGANTKDPGVSSGKDPDRQLSLMLVVLAIATAALFYAAEFRLSSALTGLDERLGGMSPITATISIEDPSALPDASPPATEAPPTFDFGGYATVPPGGDEPYPPPGVPDFDLAATADSGLPWSLETETRVPDVVPTETPASEEATTPVVKPTSAPEVTATPTGTATRSVAYPGTSEKSP